MWPNRRQSGREVRFPWHMGKGCGSQAIGQLGGRLELSSDPAGGDTGTGKAGCGIITDSALILHRQSERTRVSLPPITSGFSASTHINRGAHKHQAKHQLWLSSVGYAPIFWRKYNKFFSVGMCFHVSKGGKTYHKNTPAQMRRKKWAIIKIKRNNSYLLQQTPRQGREWNY